MEDNEVPVRIALSEQKIKDLNVVVIRVNTAIEKLSEVNTSVSRMLALHEERISKQEEIDSILFAKIDQLRDKTDEHHNNLLQRVYQLERKVWTAFGVAVTIAFFVSNYADFFGRITPTNLTPSYNSVIIEETSRDI